MPGLVPGIHVYPRTPDDVDGRDKPGHDEEDADGLKISRPYVRVLRRRGGIMQAAGLASRAKAVERATAENEEFRLE
ncbi:hypothetical protein ACVILH_000245 [Bradyrhizobium sp. USDA 4353]